MLTSRILRIITINLKRRRIFTLLLITSLLFLFLFYSFSDKAFGLANHIVDKISEKTGLNIGKTIYDFESAINIFRPKKDLWSGELPIYQLKLSENDIKHFDELAERSIEQGYLDKENNKWRRVEIKYKDKIYDAEIKLHGDLPNHWKSAYKSYNVKILDNETINNLKKFRLVIFEDRFLRRRIGNILAKEFGLFSVRDDFVVVKINGVPQGLYYLVENLDYTFLEMSQCSSCELIVMKDNKFSDHPRVEEETNALYGVDYFQSRHMSPFNYELSHVDLEKSDLDKGKVLNSINELFQAVKDEDTQKAVSFFDIDYLTSFEAERMIHGGGQVVGDNFKMVYRATNSKFYPLGFEGGEALLKVEKGGIERSLNLYNFLNGQEEVKLFALLNSDDKIRQMKYQKAYQYIANYGDSFLKKIDDLVNEYLPYANAHKGSMLGTRTIEKEIKRYKPLFEHNIQIIKEVLEYAKVYINVIKKENKVKLEIIPDSVSQLEFNTLKINLLPGESYSGEIVLEYQCKGISPVTRSYYVKDGTNFIYLTDVLKGLYFSTSLDDELSTKKRIYTLDIIFKNKDRILIDSIEIKVKNDIIGKLLADDEVYVQVANANDYYFDLISATPNDFISIYNEFDWDYRNSMLTLLKGSYVLKRDMIIPKGLIWNIEPGVQILIDDDKSIVSYSPINIMGTETEPVIVKALNPDKPFGVFAVVGEEGFKTNINWLKISSGNEKFINGLYLSGQLSLYHTDVDMRNSVISGSHSDDGLNIKYGKITVDNCLFTNNFGDQFDGDFVRGVVKNSRFIEEDPNADANGDGLDFSGSKVIVKNNIFKGFKDKGVSIGEDTKQIVLYGNMFEDNHLGAAIKDASHAFFIKNSFKDNEVALSAYQKKIIYPSGGYFYLYDNNFESNIKTYELDEKSYREDLKLDGKTYTKIEEDVTNEDLDSIFQILNSFIKK